MTPPLVRQSTSDDVIRRRQLASYEVVVCATCGLHATGSFMYGPPVCRCPLNTEPRKIVTYTLTGIRDA